MILFVILFTSLFFYQAMSVEKDCHHTIYTSNGALPYLSLGEIVTWSYPLMGKRTGRRKTQERLGNLKAFKALVQPRFTDTPQPTTVPPTTMPPTNSGTPPPTKEIDSPEAEIGKWQGYCTGLGTAEPYSAQICHHIYTFTNQGFFSGSNVYTGEEVTMLAVTGGAGGFVDGSGGVNITYLTSEDTIYHDFNLCFD
jgi:hypothetical protein